MRLRAPGREFLVQRSIEFHQVQVFLQPDQKGVQIILAHDLAVALQSQIAPVQVLAELLCAVVQAQLEPVQAWMQLGHRTDTGIGIEFVAAPDEQQHAPQAVADVVVAQEKNPGSRLPVAGAARRLAHGPDSFHSRPGL